MLLRHVLVPPEAPLPTTFRAWAAGGDVAFAALHTSGHLVSLAPGVAVLPGTGVTRTDRLTAIAHRVPPRTVVGRLSAAWIHTGHGDPQVLTVLYAPNAHRPPRRADLRTHQATLAVDDIEGVATLHVTGPLRTAVDLARHVPRDLALPALLHLSQTGLVDVAALARRLHAHRPGPCTAESLDVLEELRRQARPLATRGGPERPQPVWEAREPVTR